MTLPVPGFNARTPFHSTSLRLAKGCLIAMFVLGFAQLAWGFFIGFGMQKDVHLDLASLSASAQEAVMTRMNQQLQIIGFSGVLVMVLSFAALRWILRYQRKVNH